MVQYSLLDRRPEEEILSMAAKANVAIVTRGSVAQGLLINKPPKPYLYHSTASVKHAADAIRKLSSAQRTATQTALRYVLEDPAVTSAVVGISTVDQLRDAVTVFDTSALGEERIQLQNEIAGGTYTDHR
jgi:aryl-alcohol dehydrogenase-like predicted oxidoreductase